MPKKRALTRAEEIGRQAVGRTDLAPPKPVDEDPASIVGKSSTYEDELAALGATGTDLIDLNEIEERIGLMARVVLEYVLRMSRADMKTNRISYEAKAKLALSAIATLEGTKQEIAWKDKRLNKPKKVSVAAYKKERLEKEEKLKKILLRKKEVKIASAEAALAELEKKNKE